MIIIDLDNKTDKAFNFKKDVDEVFDTSSTLLHLKQEGDNSLYVKFTLASILLDEYLESKTNFYDINATKNTLNVFYVWNNYSDENLDSLTQYKNVFIKNLIVFQKASMVSDQSWIFGNIIAMLKWSSSAFRFKDTWLTDTHLKRIFNDRENNLLVPAWYCERIGLDVKAVV